MTTENANTAVDLFKFSASYSPRGSDLETKVWITLPGITTDADKSLLDDLATLAANYGRLALGAGLTETKSRTKEGDKITPPVTTHEALNGKTFTLHELQTVCNYGTGGSRTSERLDAEIETRLADWRQEAENMAQPMRDAGVPAETVDGFINTYMAKQRDTFSAAWKAKNAKKADS